MKSLCLYFQVHQPFRLRRYRFFDIGNDHYYYDDYMNETIMRRIADNCYLPANKLMLDLINKHKGKFKVSFSISGIALDQFEIYAPEVVDSFKKLAQTGNVEFLAETYSHSLVSLKNKEEFTAQIKEHSKKIMELFGVKPTVFRNTELVYSDEIGEMVTKLGYKAVLTEGAKHILGWKSPNYVYCNAINPKLKVLMRNYKLSDDISFRFSDKSWNEWPVTADKYIEWLKGIEEKEEIINLFMDYETFGEHQKSDTGIFDFLNAMTDAVINDGSFKFITPAEVAKELQPISAVQVPHPISWADEERDLTAWLGNYLQDEAFNKLYELSDLIIQSKDEELRKDWRYLQTSDHFYYMCTKFFSDATVHSYFNPYNSPYDAFINYMNILNDFSIRVTESLIDKSSNIEYLKGIIGKKEKQLAKYQAELKKFKKEKEQIGISKQPAKTARKSMVKEKVKIVSKTKPATKAKGAIGPKKAGTTKKRGKQTPGTKK